LALEGLEESLVHSIAARNSRSSASSWVDVGVVVGFEGGGGIAVVAGSCDDVDCECGREEDAVLVWSDEGEELHHQPIVTKGLYMLVELSWVESTWLLMKRVGRYR
jgi:hypothetical protein